MSAVDVHALWVSRAVLALLPADLPLDVPGGEIVRSADGRPTGVFLDNAMPFITAVIPPWTTSSRMQFLRATALSMLQHGLTSVHDAALTPADVRFLRKLDEQGRLPVRIYGFVGCEPTNAWCGDDEGVERYEGDRFTVRYVALLRHRLPALLISLGAKPDDPFPGTQRGQAVHRWCIGELWRRDARALLWCVRRQLASQERLPTDLDLRPCRCAEQEGVPNHGGGRAGTDHPKGALVKGEEHGGQASQLLLRPL